MKIERENKSYIKDIPTYSMPDLAFILLIFLILTSMSYYEELKKLYLPEIKTTENIESKIGKHCNIYMDINGKISIQLYDGTKIMDIEITELNKILKDYKSVNIYGDKDIKYEKIHYLLKIIEEKKIKKVGFVCEQKK